MASSKPYTAGEAIKESWKILESLKIMENSEFKEHFEKNKHEIEKLLNERARKEELLSKEVSVLLHKGSMDDVESKLANHIGKDRVDLIKTAFTIETYQMDIDKTGSVPCVRTLRGGKEFEPLVMMKSIGDIESAEMTQILSLAVEMVMFILSVIGIRVHLNESEMRAAMRAAGEVVGSSAFKRALAKFLEEWEHGGNWIRATAIFKFLKDGFPLSGFWKIVKAVLTEMSVWDYIKAAAEITATIVAAFATDGAALIAKIVLALGSAVNLAKKVANLVEMATHKKSLK